MINDQGSRPTLEQMMPANTPVAARVLYALGSGRDFGYITGANIIDDDMLQIESGKGSRFNLRFLTFTPKNEALFLERDRLYDIPLSDGQTIVLEVGKQRSQVEFSVVAGEKYDAINLMSDSSENGIGTETVFTVNGSGYFPNQVIAIGRYSSALAMGEFSPSVHETITRELGQDPTVSRFHAVATVVADQEGKYHLLVIDTSTYGTKIKEKAQ